MKYENIKIQEIRRNIENQLSTLLSITFKKNYSSSGDILNQLDKFIESLDSIFIKESPETIQQLLGGEFNKDSIYLGSEFEPEKASIPLYFSLDLLMRSIESNLLNKTKYNDQFIEILRKLNELKEAATKLEFNSIFEPNSEFSEFTMQQILDAKGNFELKKDQKEGIEYLGIVTNWENTPGHVKNGDYYQTGPTTRGFSRTMTLYQKDKDAIDDVKFQEIQKKSKKIKEIAKKYFKNGEIPVPKDLLDKLLDNNLDKRIVSALLPFSMLKARGFYDEDNASYRDFEELERIEKIVEEEKIFEAKENERTNAMEEAKERYKSKNFLWKMLHRKLNPKNLNFNDMTTEQLNDLYQKRR